MKKILPLLLVVAVMSMLFAGCQKQTDFYTNADKVLVNSQKAGELSFRLALFSKSTVNEVSCTGLVGPDTAQGEYVTEITRSNNEVLDGHVYKEFYVTYLTIKVTPPANYEGACEIKEMTLAVDGTQRKVTFSTPIKHTFTGGNVSTAALSYAIPSEISAEIISGQEKGIPYMLTAKEDLVLQKISFLDYLDVAAMTITVNGEPLEVSALPVSLKQDDRVIVNISPASAKADALSYVSTNIFFDYTKEGNDTVLTNSACLVFEPMLLAADGETAGVDQLFDSLSAQ